MPRQDSVGGERAASGAPGRSATEASDSAAAEATESTSTGQGGRAAKGGTPPARGRGLRRLLQGRYLPYVLVAPALLFELLVHIIPMLTGVVVSFFRLNQFYFQNWLEAPFVALSNFRVALDQGNPIGAGLLHSIGVTVAFTIVTIGLSWLLGIAGALAINEQRRFRGTLQAVLLIPYALPVYVAIINWRFILQKDGALNALLTDTGIIETAPFWLFGANAFWSMVMAAVWKHWPFAFLILLAGLQSVQPELYHAASVDGASAWRKFRHITLPMLRPVNSVLLLVLFLWTFNDFNVPFTLFGGAAAPESADVLAVHIYVNSFVNFNFGLGAAMSVLLLLFLIVLSAIYVRVFRVGGDQNA